LRHSGRAAVLRLVDWTAWSAVVLNAATFAVAIPSLGFRAVHYCAEPLGSWWALTIGLAICIAWSGLLLIVRTRQA
jgi:hypothetical protein